MKLLQPITKKCGIWMSENIYDGFEPEDSIPVENSYLADIINEGLTPEGFVYDEDYTTIPSLI